MRRVGVRLPDRAWKSVALYAKAAGFFGVNGQLAISEAVRDLIARGLITDRSVEAGYRSGYSAGRLAGYAEIMRRLNGGST